MESSTAAAGQPQQQTSSLHYGDLVLLNIENIGAFI